MYDFKLAIEMHSEYLKQSREMLAAGDRKGSVFMFEYAAKARREMFEHIPVLTETDRERLANLRQERDNPQTTEGIFWKLKTGTGLDDGELSELAYLEMLEREVCEYVEFKQKRENEKMINPFETIRENLKTQIAEIDQRLERARNVLDGTPFVLIEPETGRALLNGNDNGNWIVGQPGAALLGIPHYPRQIAKIIAAHIERQGGPVLVPVDWREHVANERRGLAETLALVERTIEGGRTHA